ncbi:DUF3310 domain-containing protein [Fibrobacter sp.]|uniref:DUF3310 domain-containing protein n=1 Tax=Fibrobacter sp. TaxID=35828 RepID=UPI0025B8130D|nr:DUF3310 domain-containing protein [Fibrobacter sp.]MBR3071051.1 DUF3310 domain-containing protein [Fibrobacter sp.]
MTKPTPNQPQKKQTYYNEMPVETIKIIHAIVKRPQIPREAAYDIGNAVKYQCRAGLKPDNNWEDDIRKAENYLHHARTGEWIKE